jgi:hypothetical protein
VAKLLTPWHRILFEKLIVTQLAKCRNKCREDKVYYYVLSSELRTEPEYKDN